MTLPTRAPLYQDGYTLCAWLIGQLGDQPDVLPRAVCGDALALCDHLVLALSGIDRPMHIDDADGRLVLLRVHVQLAAETGYLTDRQMLHALTIADRIGRQLGGWQRSQDMASS